MRRDRIALNDRAAALLRRAATRLDHREVAPVEPAPVEAAPVETKPQPKTQRQQAPDLPAEWFAQSDPGSRAASMFFDSYPRFYETSNTTATRGRLNLRYEAIFAENPDILAGARVLDIASHDGRWSLAALECGAASVVGIEARADLVDEAVKTLDGLGWDSDRCTFIAGDVFEVLAKQKFEVDVVLCLGFLYHTLRFNELMHGIRAANPRHLIIDTASRVMMGKSALIGVKREPVSQERNAVADEYSFGDAALVGQPNLRAISLMALAYGFEVERVSDWDGLVRDNPDLVALGDVNDYVNHVRTTIRCRALPTESA